MGNTRRPQRMKLIAPGMPSLACVHSSSDIHRLTGDMLPRLRAMAVAFAPSPGMEGELLSEAVAGAMESLLDLPVSAEASCDREPWRTAMLSGALRAIERFLNEEAAVAETEVATDPHLLRDIQRLDEIARGTLATPERIMAALECDEGYARRLWRCIHTPELGCGPDRSAAREAVH